MLHLSVIGIENLSTFSRKKKHLNLNNAYIVIYYTSYAASHYPLVTGCISQSNRISLLRNQEPCQFVICCDLLILQCS